MPVIPAFSKAEMDWEDEGSRMAKAKSSFSRPHLQNNQNTVDQRSGSSGRMLAL
jgi:hypothetical protein